MFIQRMYNLQYLIPKYKLSLRIFINMSLSAVSDPQIFKLFPNEHLARIQNWMSQSNPDRIS